MPLVSRDSGSHILDMCGKKWVPNVPVESHGEPKEERVNGEWVAEAAQGVRRFRGVLDSFVPYGLQMDNHEDRKDWTAG